LDEFGSLDGLVEEYLIPYNHLTARFSELRALSRKENELKEKRDYMNSRSKKLDSVDPRRGEEEDFGE